MLPLTDRVSRVVHTGRILELDGLRALALLWVMSFHFSIGSPLANPVSGLGWAGVDLFFVLSGYLITGILLHARSRPHYFSTFYTRRTLRIFPVYYLLLLIYVLAARSLGGAQPWTYWIMHAAFFSSVGEYFHFWAFAAPGFVYAGVTVLWSLSIEEMFYLLWAPLVRWAGDRKLWFVVLAIIAGAPLLRFLIHTPAYPEYRFLPARFDSLAWGAALAMGLEAAAAHRRAGRTTGWGRLESARFWRTLLLGSGLGLAALIAITGDGRESRAMASIGYSALALVFTAGLGWTLTRAGSRAAVCRLLRWAPARHLGTISYTAYLVHYPIFMLVGTHLGTRLGTGTAGAGWRAGLSFLLAIAVASASWYYLESPILRLKDRWAPRPDARPPAPSRAARGPQPAILKPQC